jgi:hypothetical protein
MNRSMLKFILKENGFSSNGYCNDVILFNDKFSIETNRSDCCQIKQKHNECETTIDYRDRNFINILKVYIPDLKCSLEELPNLKTSLQIIELANSQFEILKNSLNKNSFDFVKIKLTEIIEERESI